MSCDLLLGLDLDVAYDLVVTDSSGRRLNALLIELEPIEFRVAERPQAEAVPIHADAVVIVEQLPRLKFAEVVSRIVPQSTTN